MLRNDPIIIPSAFPRRPALENAFDRVVVINLARRHDRLTRFPSLMNDWPFKTPERFNAIDGSARPTPSGWEKGAGAWGCLQSHRQVLDEAIADGNESLMVLEDDARPVNDLAERAAEFMHNVPADWDGLMLGAEHLEAPIPAARGVVRCRISVRNHAYAVRGRFMRVLSDFWRNATNDHCDVVMAGLMLHFKIYAPTPLLIGQDSGHSDITGRLEHLRFLSAQQKAAIAHRDSAYRIEKLLSPAPTSSLKKSA